MDSEISMIFNTMKNKDEINKTSNHFAVLKIFFPENSSNDEFIQLYKRKSIEQNLNIMNNPFPDSGFDLFLPNNIEFEPKIESTFVDMKVKAEMFYCNIITNTITPTPFQIFARSSISKTPLMLANHTGIIDSGYRGNLIAAFRNLGPTTYMVDKYTRLAQICHPTLCPIFVFFSDDENEITTTERGIGGFGSTG